MPLQKQMEEDKGQWPEKLLTAIAYQAIVDYIQGCLGLYDSSCIPLMRSKQECKNFVSEAETFFKGTKYEKMLPQLKSAVPEFVRGMRETRPGENGSPGLFRCPNCGGIVSVFWVDKKKGITKSKCIDGCAFQSVYHLPKKEVEAMAKDG